jgi:ribonuclease-3 family protein
LFIDDHHYQGESQPQSGSEDEVTISCSFIFPLKVKNSSLKQLSPTALAYLGDAVYELYFRSLFLLPPKRITDYHQQVVNNVRAETQAFYLQKIQPYLTPTEQEVVRRGRNATKGIPKRLEPEIYRQATSLETLIGYLYLYDPPRLQSLLSLLIRE